MLKRKFIKFFIFFLCSPLFSSTISLISLKTACYKFDCNDINIYKYNKELTLPFLSLNAKKIYYLTISRNINMPKINRDKKNNDFNSCILLKINLIISGNNINYTNNLYIDLNKNNFSKDKICFKKGKKYTFLLKKEDLKNARKQQTTSYFKAY